MHSSSPDPTFTAPALGIPTAVWEYGDPRGATIIMVHGFRGDHHGLEGLARELSRALPSLRILVPDLPGFGRTPAASDRPHTAALFGKWLAAFAATVAPSGCALVAHSFGTIVTGSALAEGLRPAAVVLINPIAAPALAGPQAVLSKLALGFYRGASLLGERSARALLGNSAIVRGMSEVMAKTRDPQLRSWIHQQHAQYFSSFADSRSLLQAFDTSISHTVTEEAHHFEMPTLVIAGDRDDITPLPQQLALVRRLPRAELQILPGVGHLVHYEAVDEAVSGISGFFARRFGLHSSAEGQRKAQPGKEQTCA